jgi:hypothetical protein
MCDKNQYYVECNSSGYQTKESFQNMFETHFFFLLIARRQQLYMENQKILIIMDIHTSRLNRKFYIKAKSNNIHFFTIPSHCSHFLQPLDVTVNGVFKQFISKYYVVPEISSQVYYLYTYPSIYLYLFIYFLIFIRVT